MNSYNKYSEKYCDKFLDIFYKCNITQDSYTKDKCNQIEKILKDSLLNLYLKCEQNKK